MTGELLGLATTTTDPTSSTDIGPGLTAFLIVLGMIVATVFLMRSMLRQLRKVPPTFDSAEDAPADEGADHPQTP